MIAVGWLWISDVDKFGCGAHSSARCDDVLCLGTRFVVLAVIVE